jgi:hypothetical protein
MTRDQQVHAALRLLNPDPERRDECERAINEALDWIARQTLVGQIGSKRHKAALAKFHAALRRTELARNALLGPERQWTEAGHADLPALPLSPWIEFCEQQLAQPRTRWGRKFANARYYAAWEAKSLLQQWSRRRISQTRGGPWAKLAAILHGQPRADLFRTIQRFRPHILP